MYGTRVNLKSYSGFPCLPKTYSLASLPQSEECLRCGCVFQEQNRQMFMKLYGLDVDVDDGDKDLRTELRRYLLQKHERSFQKNSVPPVRPPEAYIVYPSSS